MARGAGRTEVNELNIVQVLNDKTLEFGNERFLEGWNGAMAWFAELIVKHELQVDEGGGVACKCGQLVGWSDWDYQNHLLALIKGEQK